MKTTWSMLLTCCVSLWGCAHEQLSVSRVLSCPGSELTIVAEGYGRDFDEPRDVTASQSAVSATLMGVGALLSGLTGNNPQAFVPAQGTQIASPGWRHYQGCGKGLICFDGGTCLKVDDEAGARRVPALMADSVRELGPALLDERCADRRVFADRRGPLVWSLSSCHRYLGCAARGERYGCVDPDGKDVLAPKRP